MGILSLSIVLIQILLLLRQDAWAKVHRRKVDYRKLAHNLLAMRRGTSENLDSKSDENNSEEVENPLEGDIIMIENLQKEIQWERQQREQLDKRFIALQKGLVIEKSFRKDALKGFTDDGMQLFNKTAMLLNYQIDTLQKETKDSQNKFRDEVRVSLENINGIVTEIVEKLSVSNGTNGEGLSVPLVSKSGPFLKWMNKTSQLKGIGSSCKDNTDCWINKTECRENTCYCAPGRSYNPENWTCVRSCTKYGRSFQKVVGYYIKGNDEATLKNISEEDCKSECSSATPFTCITVDYFQKKRLCYLQSATKLEVNERSWVHVRNKMVYHFQRDCA